MPNKNDALVDDVNFIFSECIRINKMINDGEFKNIPHEDLLCDLSNPTPDWPGRKMMCGHAAFVTLESLTVRALERAKLRDCVSVATARDMLGGILVRKFVREGFPIEIKHVDRAMSEMGKVCRKICQDLTHYIPCSLMSANKPSFFEIGPVRFLDQRKFRSVLARHIKNERKRDRRPKFGVKIARHAIDYYRKFGWVAEITVIGCERSVSEALSFKSAFAALNCLHLIIGPGHTKNMIVGGPGIEHDRRGGFAVSSEGRLSYRTSYGLTGEAGFEDDWFDLFVNGDMQDVITNLGVALEHVVNPSLRRPLSQRLVDAVQWYGEAVRETSSAAKVVKFVTALERMIMTGEKDDIAGVVSSRVAALCLDEPSKDRLEVLRCDVKRAYDIRSKIVHGAISPSSEIVRDGVRLGARIACDALLIVARLLGSGLRDEEATVEQLSQWYDRIIDHANSAIKAAENPA